MSSEKINQPLEKVNTSNNNNLEEKNEIKESISQNNGDQTYSQRIHSDNIFQEENDQNSEKEDKLKLYTPFKINAFYQILINKIMPPGYKLETEEILLKKDEKRQKTYLHRKHKKNSSILDIKNDNENNNINNLNIENKNSEDNFDTKNKMKELVEEDDI